MSSDAMSVRGARATDRTEMLELWERSVRATHHFLSERDIQQLKPLVAELFENSPLELWVVVRSAGEVIVPRHSGFDGLLACSSAPWVSRAGLKYREYACACARAPRSRNPAPSTHQIPCGEVLGFLGYTQHSVEALFVDPEQRGRGAGKLLMAHAQTLSGAALSVDVNEQNEGAVGFYRAQGFEVVSRSELDAQGRPFPTLHMRRAAP